MGLLITSLIVIGMLGFLSVCGYVIVDTIDEMTTDERFFTPVTYVPGPIFEAPTPEEIERVKNYLKSDVKEYKPTLDPDLPKFNYEDIPGFNPKPLPIPTDNPIYDLNNIPSYDLNDIPSYDLDSIPVYDLDIPIYDLDIPIYDTSNIPSFDPR